MKIDQNTNSFKINCVKKDGIETEKNVTIFAGNLNVNNDPIAKKRQEAQEKALKVVGDAFDNDKKIDDDLQKRSNHISKLYENMESASKEIGNIEKNKLELRESYGIKDDSEEQKDLELLEKRRDSLEIGSTITLSDEEKERLSEIDKAGKTEYQTRSLQMDVVASSFKKEIKESKKVIIEENAIIRGIKLERLKTSPMMEAAEKADDILDAASDEITGMLLDEAKEHIDEKAKEEQEEAEKKAEEKEKQEEQAEAVKEKREEESDGTVNSEIPIDNILEMTHEESNIKKEVENIVDKMKLVAEDIKGSVVDSKL